MYILLMLWAVIDLVFLFILFFRKQSAKYQNEMWQRSIERGKSSGDRLLDILSEMCSVFFLLIIIYILIYIISDIWIQKLLEWYKGIFIIALFPALFSWFKWENYNVRLMWNKILFFLTCFLSMTGSFIDAENIELIIQYRNILNVLITIYVVIFLEALYGMIKENKKNYSKRLPKKGIRKDLYYRTPRLLVNVSDVELIKHCERYFDEYICKYKKISDLRAIEYVNLAGIHRKLWYKKAARFMKVFVAVSILTVIIDMKFGISFEKFGVIGLISIFGALVTIYKHIDLECLYEIGIRYAYDQWGYYLIYASKSKFVGNVQMIAISKFHKYVYSVLDIAALCRAVAFIDKMSGEKRIRIITKNLNELFVNYTDYEEIQNWIMIIPLWIAALFEFYVTGGVTEEIKTTLQMSVDENKKADLKIFLQSFWADMERKKLENGILDYLKLFEAELYI